MSIELIKINDKKGDLIMLTKEQIKEVFKKICEFDVNFDVVLETYQDYIDKKAKNAGIIVDSDEHKEFCKNEKEEAVPWVVDRLVNDKVVDYINKNMEYVPIVEFSGDEALDEINFGITELVDFFKNEHVKNREDVLPNIFDVKACRVGSTGIDSGGIRGSFRYSIGDYVTYILADGTYAIVEEKTYGYEDESDLVVRRLVCDACPLLDELDDLFDEDLQGLFDV